MEQPDYNFLHYNDKRDYRLIKFNNQLNNFFLSLLFISLILVWSFSY